MSQLTPEQIKIHTKIAEDLSLSAREVDKVIESFNRGIKSLIEAPTPCKIFVPYLGTYEARETFLKKFNEVSNTSQWDTSI